ncbi:Os11g0218500 [Oryza sativa Japonica Group]|uniref:Os11g0218500 protein n=1 Tax=Oryza sativa subsp. japonica TaxID=39947 RepID=C7J862_ORYSJ|nr:Os11g0218500 [Oryza sativa Japonica Group]|eukprot:NP_001176430.1 Os11g0218500 [Oryza sativa Japonica Group]
MQRHAPARAAPHPRLQGQAMGSPPCPSPPPHSPSEQRSYGHGEAAANSSKATKLDGGHNDEPLGGSVLLLHPSSSSRRPPTFNRRPPSSPTFCHQPPIQI